MPDPTALFTTAEARAFTAEGQTPLSDATAYPDATITAIEPVIRARFEAACRVAFIPTTITETLDGNATNVLCVRHANPTHESPRQPLTVTAATIDGVALTATELAAIKAHPDGRLLRSDGQSWSSSTGYEDLAVTVTYKFGWSAVPALIKRAACLYAVRLLCQGELPGTSYDYADGGPARRFPYPGQRPHWTGDDEIDSVLCLFEEGRVVIV